MGTSKYVYLRVLKPCGVRVSRLSSGISNVKRKKIGFKLDAQHLHYAAVFQLGNLVIATRPCVGLGGKADVAARHVDAIV